MEALRSELPVVRRVAYLNAGTNGPVPTRSIEAASQSLREQLEHGRAGHAFFIGVLERQEQLRSRVAALLGCEPGELALTGSTTDGVNSVLGALDLGEGDEVLTSDEEHPGVLAPAAGLRERHGVAVRTAPLSELAAAVGPRTRLVACSHVSWSTGAVVDSAALARTGVPVLLDGAQALGAVPVDVRALGCDFYAASGQKWLCGPNGTGYLYVRAERVGELLPAAPTYASLTDPSRPLDFELQQEARRFDSVLLGPHQAAWALASLDLYESVGWDAVHTRARELASRLARQLADAGLEVAPRGSSTLVSWSDPDPDKAVERLAAADVILRQIPGSGRLRASVGAWTIEAELDRLVELVTSGS